MSSLYRFELGVLVPAGVEIDTFAALGSRVTLHIDREAPAALYHGVLSSVELVDALPERAYYLLSVVPELWHLTQSLHSRIFTDNTIPEIIEAVLQASHIPAGGFSLRLTAAYPSRMHVCQYKESDYAFISRLMEHVGLYYFFEHGADRETLVITDNNSTHSQLTAPATRYSTWSSEAEQQGGLKTFAYKMSARPGEVSLSDYDYLNPSLDVRGQAQVQPRGRGRVVMHGENFRTPAEGQQLARIRAEQLLASQAVYRGGGTVFSMRSGAVFALDNHPLPSLNREYLLTAVRHRGRRVAGVEALDALLGLSADDGYHVDIDAIAADVQWRTPSRTPWPRVDGAVDGVVDGHADSPYAQIDEHGRYKVKIFFDESDLIDGSASTWIRMLQPHGGGTEGFHFPLRKGTEVHIVFLDGDPDRPSIVGVAPNMHKPSKVTDANFTKNVIVTGGSNRMELEDIAGGQYVTTSTPALDTFVHMGTDLGDGYNFVTSTLGNAREFVGGYEDKLTIGHQTELVTGFVRGTYESTVDTTILGALTETFDSSQTRAVTGPVTMMLNDTLSEQIAGAVQRTEQSSHDETIVGAAGYHFHSSKDVTIDAALSLTTHGDTLEVHNANKTTSVSGVHSQQIGGEQQLQSFTSQTMAAPEQTFAAEGQQLHVGDVVVVQAASEANVVSAGTVTVHADGSVTITSASVTVAGSSTVSVEGATVGVNGSTVAVEGGEVNILGGLVKIN